MKFNLSLGASPGLVRPAPSLKRLLSCGPAPSIREVVPPWLHYPCHRRYPMAEEEPSDCLKGSGDVAGQISRSLGGGSNPIEFEFVRGNLACRFRYSASSRKRYLVAC